MTDNGSAESPLRVAVIGLGVGEQHAWAVAQHPGAELELLCDIDEARLEALAGRFPNSQRRTDWRGVVEDPEVDVVVIATYDGDHSEHVLAAIQHGKHVFVEKPLCTSSQDLASIRSALNQHPEQRLSSNLVLRREPRFLELRDRIRSGRLGTPFLLEGGYDYGRIQKLTEGWRGRELGYSVMHGGGVHLIDLLLWLKGDGEVEEVVAYGSGVATRGTSFAGRDLSLALLRFADGTLARVSANFASMTPHHHQVAVYGTAGTFQQSHAGVGYLWSRDGGRAHQATDGAADSLQPDGYPYPVASKGALLGAFIDRLHGIVSDAPTEEETLKAMSISLAIEAAIECGTPVRVKDFE